MRRLRGWFSNALEESRIQEDNRHCNCPAFASRLAMVASATRRFGKQVSCERPKQKDAENKEVKNAERWQSPVECT